MTMKTSPDLLNIARQTALLFAGQVFHLAPDEAILVALYEIRKLVALFDAEPVSKFITRVNAEKYSAKRNATLHGAISEAQEIRALLRLMFKVLMWLERECARRGLNMKPWRTRKRAIKTLGEMGIFAEAGETKCRPN